MNGIDHPDIDFVILADSAQVADGKLFMLGGGWDRLSVLDFKQPVSFSIAIAVMVPWSDTNEPHELTLFIENADGAKVTPEFKFVVNVGRPPHAVKGQAFRTPIAVSGAWQLPGPDTYRVVVSLRGGSARRSVFYAVDASPQRLGTPESAPNP
jgi:hypothetical protein